MTGNAQTPTDNCFKQQTNRLANRLSEDGLPIQRLQMFCVTLGVKYVVDGTKRCKIACTPYAALI